MQAGTIQLKSVDPRSPWTSLQAFPERLGVNGHCSSGRCFDGFRYPPVIYKHGQKVGPLHFFAEDRTHGNGVKRANEFMKAMLIIADRCRVAAIPINPRPVRDPAHDRGVPMQRTALKRLVGTEYFGQAVGGCQKDKPPAMQQAVCLQPHLTKTVRNVFETRRPGHDENLLADL